MNLVNFGGMGMFGIPFAGTSFDNCPKDKAPQLFWCLIHDGLLFRFRKLKILKSRTQNISLDFRGNPIEIPLKPWFGKREIQISLLEYVIICEGERPSL